MPFSGLSNQIVLTLQVNNAIQAFLGSEASVLTVSGLARTFFPEGGFAALKVEKFGGDTGPVGIWTEVEVFCKTLYPATESEDGVNEGVNHDPHTTSTLTLNPKLLTLNPDPEP